jgi:hypothetical protein
VRNCINREIYFGYGRLEVVPKERTGSPSDELCVEGSALNTHEYSSLSSHGDADHNNAGAIDAVKSIIASIT